MGTTFGDDSTDYIRISYLQPLRMIQEAMRRITAFAAQRGPPHDAPIDGQVRGYRDYLISFIDEGGGGGSGDAPTRVGVYVLTPGAPTGPARSGRSISHELDGWPDHGVPEPYQMRGGSINST